LDEYLEDSQANAVLQAKTGLCVLTARNLAPTFSKPKLHGVDDVAVFGRNPFQQWLLRVEESVMVREQSHRLAIKDAIGFIVYSVADFEKIEARADQEPIYIGLWKHQSVGECEHQEYYNFTNTYRDREVGQDVRPAQVSLLLESYPHTTLVYAALSRGRTPRICAVEAPTVGRRSERAVS
jgi:hypothetical protein